MAVPGSNLLNLALTVIARQQFVYYGYTGRVTNAVGIDVAAYAPPLVFSGSVQPVPRYLYEQMGLDMQANHFNVFLSKNALDIARDISGDYFVYAGMRLQCLSKTDWHSMDGWMQVLCVETPFLDNPDEPDYRITTTGDARITTDGDFRIVPKAVDDAEYRVTDSGAQRITTDNDDRIVAQP